MLSALKDKSVVSLNINYFESKVVSLRLRQMNAVIVESCVFSSKKTTETIKSDLQI